MSIWEWLFVGTGMGLLAFLAVALVLLVYALERVKDVGVAICERADAWGEKRIRLERAEAAVMALEGVQRYTIATGVDGGTMTPYPDKHSEYVKLNEAKAAAQAELDEAVSLLGKEGE